MKKLSIMKSAFLLPAALMLAGLAAHAQHMALPETTNQGGKFFVQTKMTRSCGDYSDLSFIVMNRTNSMVDIKLFVEKRDGTWQSLGYANGFKSGATTGGTNSFWSCSNTGRWVIYYRVSGTDDQFPGEKYVNDQFGRKY